MQQNRHVWLVLLAGSLLNVFVIWASPSLHPALWLAARAGYSVVCHQAPARCLSVAGLPLPVCARCAAIYTALPLGAVIALLWFRCRATVGDRRSPIGRRAFIVALTLALLVVLVEKAAEKCGFATTNLTRYWASFPLATLAGMVSAFVLLPAGALGGIGPADADDPICEKGSVI